ncbi:ABC transporter permease [Candidatus Pristimantibacillus sp. PTI5]|uniref:ABC transporter permease n=1 Tax=Candidatus Pristimantibacillus sp. PTI5 TaxID=3400422 RepID=UPI003B02DB63
MWEQISDYFLNSYHDYINALKEHIAISMITLIVSAIIGITCGYLCVKHKQYERAVVFIFQVLRVVPSLAVILLLIPMMGTGVRPALIALVLLAIPPILMNTVAGLQEASPSLLEAAYGIGMSDRQVWLKIKFPLASPMILTGLKIAAIEVIASATLAAKIGAGGLGEIIFTGLGLNRMDLLLIGGISVAVLSITSGLLLDLIERYWFKYKLVRK